MEFIFKSMEFIEENLGEKLTTNLIAFNIGYSPYYFTRAFKRHVGLSPMEYVKERRLTQASKEIIYGEKIIDVAIKFGYESHSAFTRAFNKRYGYSPIILKTYRLNNILGSDYTMEHMFLRGIPDKAGADNLYKLLLETMDKNGINYDIAKVSQAYDLASKAHYGHKRYSGDDYITHPLCVAILLAELEADEKMIIIGLLHDTITKGEGIALHDISNEFSQDIANLIAEILDGDRNKYSDEALIIILAKRLHNMRTIEHIDKARWNQKAKETLELILPLTSKVDKLCMELSDIATKYIKST